MILIKIYHNKKYWVKRISFALSIICLILLTISATKNPQFYENQNHMFIKKTELNSRFISILDENSTQNYTIVEPSYEYREAKNQYVEWIVDGHNGSFWVNWSYTLLVWVNDNISVVFEASKKTAADGSSSQTSYDFYVKYSLKGVNGTVESQFHIDHVYLDIFNHERSYMNFNDINNVTVGPIETGYEGIYPFIKWNLTYPNFVVPIEEGFNTTVNITVKSKVLITESEFKVKIGLSSFFNNYGMIGNVTNATFVIPYSYGVGINRINTGEFIYPSRVENNTVYYEYNNLTLQTVKLNDSCIVEFINNTSIRWKTNITLEVSGWTSFFEYKVLDIPIREIKFLQIDPEVIVGGDFVVPVSNPPSDEEKPPTPPESNSSLQENTQHGILFDLERIISNPIIYTVPVIAIVSIGILLFKRKRISYS